MITDEMRENKKIIKYKVDNFDIIFANGDIEKLNGDMVTHIYIEKDYDSLYFPIINISIVMRDRIYQRIQEENETVMFRVRVIKNIYDKDYNLLKYELYFNELFQCFKDKDNIIKDIENTESKEYNEGEEAVTMGTNTRDFYLFTDEITKCKKMFNLSIASASLSDLLIYMIGDVGIDKLLMSKLDNNENLSGVIIPSGDLVDSINYLNNLKAFYKKGMLLFFDIDTTFLIDLNYECTAWRKNEIRVTCIHIANQQSNDSQLNGYYEDEDRKQTHVFANTDRVQVKNTNILSNQIHGNNIKIIDSKNDSTTTVGANTTSINGNNEQLLMVKDGNNYTTSELQTRLEENECISGIMLVGVDTEVVSPNKEIIVKYEDATLNKQYGGNYRVCKTTTTLKKDASELAGEVQVLLKKQK